MAWMPTFLGFQKKGGKVWSFTVSPFDPRAWYGFFRENITFQRLFGLLLASPDALEVIVVTYSLTHLLTESALALT